MKVVADSHALVRYLVDPERLSEPALGALLEAEDTDGVIISATTLLAVLNSERFVDRSSAKV